ncbi:hypothetical protein SAMN06265347_110122 [Halobellus salinus]|nr:hypothetical protein SAMN06265347_110122 [Halobellus salinus]
MSVSTSHLNLTSPHSEMTVSILRSYRLATKNYRPIFSYILLNLVLSSR